jgi:hypothetical protein
MPIIQEIFEFLKTAPDVANAISAMAGVAVAALAFIVSAISLVVSVRTLKHQREHNTLSVRPLPEVTVADYENSLRVKLRNNGSGPMIIQSLSVTDGATTCESLIECMPELPGRHWTHFSNALSNRSLMPGSEIVLLALTEEDGELGFSWSRDLARRALSPLTVSVKYTDVYKSGFNPYTKALDWFGRHQRP